MYASYHYSHPILTERLSALGWYAQKEGGKVSKDEAKVVKAADREL